MLVWTMFRSCGWYNKGLRILDGFTRFICNVDLLTQTRAAVLAEVEQAEHAIYL